MLASASFASGILFANIYNSLVNAAAADANIPTSIIAAREYFKSVNPGDFFKIFSPFTQLLALAALILFWKKSVSIRLLLAIALACYISGDIFAFLYFHPRSDIMFVSEKLPDTETLKRLSHEWSTMNWVRSFILFVGVVCSFLAIDKIYSKQVTGKQPVL
ncbi:hypothetical protein AM493_11015 [Flavobacterium akiainvivens]|uniref:DUF1772 domain-containing protein n=2 Tax=Flavobacterium akiainvivens TaxID=1202724 RepID=A0A0N0RQS2_9FLAO|nr:hypothetical protein AM493_11015 [Flavobacterium akiainvivens]SFQ11844.1 protein of unknown function [Flavobacterium akiainvivens]